MTLDPIESIMRDLHPACEQAFRSLTADLQRAYEKDETTFHIRPIEGFRTPRQQEVLFAKRPIVEHRGKWQSPHTYGLAVKFGGVSYSGEHRVRELDDHDKAFFCNAANVAGLVVDAYHTTTAVHLLWSMIFQSALARFR